MNDLLVRSVIRMANTFFPFGFTQRSGNGSAPTYEQVTRLITSTTANIFFGDPVFSISDGSIAGITTGPGPSTSAIAGIFVGCVYISIAQKRQVWSNYWPGSDANTAAPITAYICNDPNAQFLAQVGTSTSTGLVAANVALNVQFAYGTGNTSSGISGAYIDISVAPAVTATFPFRVVSLVTSPPGAPGTAAGANNYAVVAFNNVETKQLTAV